MATILVTRPELDAQRTTARLRADGHEAIASPVLVVSPLDAPPPDGRVDAILIASANAAPWLRRADVRAALGDAPVFAVGAHAAEAVAQAGYGDVRSADGAADDLVELVFRAIAPPAKLLAPVGRVHGEAALEALRARGYDVASLVVYDAALAEQLSPEAVAGLRYDVIDAALHYSARSAAAVFDLAQRAGERNKLQRIKHVCLSREILESLPDDIRPQATAAEAPNEESLMAALASALGAPASSAEQLAQPNPSDDATLRPRRAQRARSPRVIDGNARLVAEDDAPPPSIDPPAAAASEIAPDPVTPVSPTRAHASSDTMAAKENAAAARAEVRPEEKPARAEAPRREPEARSRPAIAAALLVGALAGAGAGAATAFWAVDRLTPPRQPSIDLSGVETRLAGLAPQADVAAARRAIDQLAATVERDRAALRADISAVAQRVAAAGNPSPAPAAIDPAMRDAIAANAASLAALNSKLQALETRIETLSRASAEQAADAGATDAVRRHALANAVARALERGDAYAGELDALASLGASPERISALRIYASGGAPSASALAAQFKDLAPRLLEPSAQPTNRSWSERAMASIAQLVRVRPIGDVGGEDRAAIAARIEAALARGALGDALSASSRLPAPQRAVIADWSRRLQERVAAASAAQALLEDGARGLAAPTK